MIFTEKDLKNHEKVIGLRQVVRCINDNRLRCVLVAKDADEHIQRELAARCKEEGLPLYVQMTKKALGEIAGIDVNCATLGLLK